MNEDRQIKSSCVSIVLLSPPDTTTHQCGKVQVRETRSTALFPDAAFSPILSFMSDSLHDHVAALPIETIPIAHIARDAPGWDTFLLRRRPGKLGMRASLEAHGQLAPVLLHATVPGGADDTLRVVDGFARIAAARDLGWSHASAQVLRDARLSDVSVFLMALRRQHAGAPRSLTDNSFAIHRTCRMGMSLSAIARDVLPALGLDLGTRAAEDLAGVARLPDEVLDAFEDGRLSEPQLKALAPLDDASRDRLFRDAFLDSRLGASETREFTALVDDLAERDALPISEVLSRALAEAPDAPPPARVRAALDALRRLRFPRLAETRERFAEVAATLRAIRGLGVEDPGAFEKNAIALSLSFEDPKTLAAQIDALRQALDDGRIARLIEIVQGDRT